MEHQLWITALLNKALGGPVTSLLSALGIHPASPENPIPDYFAMEILIALALVALFLWLRGQMSYDKPGKVQQLLEIVVDGLGQQTEEIVGHGGKRFVPILFTLALFILVSNVMGEVPIFVTPTQTIFVTLGCAMVAFAYYNAHGIKHHGILGYLRTFMGPMLWMAPLMFVIELISHLARLLSLSVRLYANMLAGEKITEIIFEKFLGIGAPVIFMTMHIFVGLLQAYIFVFLTMIYLGGAVSEEH